MRRQAAQTFYTPPHDLEIEKTMKRVLIAFACTFVVHSFTDIAFADDDFHGIIESRPDGKTGTWVVGGRSAEATERTRLEEQHGPLKVGGCAEVELEGGVIEEIESEPPHKCGQ